MSAPLVADYGGSYIHVALVADIKNNNIHR